MLWQHYVFRRGAGVPALWDAMFEQRRVRLLYIAGRGFDTRAQAVMNSFVSNVSLSGHTMEKADLLLVGLSGYRLSSELKEHTKQNAAALEAAFRPLGSAQDVSIGPSDGEDDISASTALRLGVEAVLRHVTDQSDIVLDVSTLPRVAYLALLTGILQKLIPNKKAPNPLAANGVNFQVLVAEDAALDGKIRSEDPDNDLVLIPGFSSALHAESVQDWPLVWFPVLGENRMNQLQKVMESIPNNAEICPVLPQPSSDLRRADRLLVEYKSPLFDARQTPIANVLYAHESHPFEAYRQMLGAMNRYRESMGVLGGCRLVVTPLGSKLITLGAGLACFEIRPTEVSENFGIAIPFAQPTRYDVPIEALSSSKAEISTLLLTGDAYR
jgi:hypothetical protein